MLKMGMKKMYKNKKEMWLWGRVGKWAEPVP